jgi:hypothetical protein
MTDDLELLVKQVFLNVFEIKIGIKDSLSFVTLVVCMGDDNQIVSRSSELKVHFEFLIFGIADDAV